VVGLWAGGTAAVILNIGWRAGAIVACATVTIGLTLYERRDALRSIVGSVGVD